jgi:hypothetical protein
MKFILMGLLRQFRKNYGREPSFDELRTLGNQAKEIEQLDRGQVIPFPQTRITDPFTPRPKEGELSVTIKGKRKNMTPEGIMDMLMGKGKAKDVNLGKAPKTKKTKDPVDPELERQETEKEMIDRMNRENKEAVERFKKKFKMEDDPEKMSGGGLAGFAGDQFTQDTRDTFMYNNQLFTNPMPQMIPGGILQNMPQMMQPMQTGIMSLEEGGPVDPSKRKFIKILGGLAAIPVLNKFIKPAIKVAQNPEVARRFSGVPAYFTKLVEKIKMFGDDAPGLTSVEREVGKKYKDYELVEDLSSGEIVVKRNKQGVSMMGDDMVEGTMQEEVMAFRPRKTTEDGIIPEEYEEVTVKPDMEGKMKEVEDGLDSLDDILLEVGERSNKAGGGLAYMLGE